MDYKSWENFFIFFELKSSKKLSFYMWSKKIDLPQLFCELRTLPELHINWKWKFSNKQNCIGKDHFQSKTYFVCMCNISISQKVITIPPLYPLFKWSVPFDPQIRCRISFIWLFAIWKCCTYIQSMFLIENYLSQCSCFGLKTFIFSLYWF